MSVQGECDLPGGRKRDGLAVNGDSGHPGTQVTATNLQRELRLCRLLNEPPFLFAHLKPCLARGHAIFSLPGRGVRDAIVMTGGTQTPDMPGMMGDT